MNSFGLGGPVSVLLAEDNVTSQLLTSAILESAGMAVDIVSDGREALDALGRRPYDVVLMDGQMPELDGYAATRELRRREHGMWRTPVVALTASSTHEDRKRCLDAGMDDYLAKPVRRRALVDVVLRWARPGHAEPAGLRDDSEVLPVLDPVVVGELRLLGAGRPEFLAEIVWLFGHDLAPKVVELEIAHRLCDWEAVQRIAHRIRGTACQVGAAALDRVCARLELATPDDLADHAADLIQVQHEFERANQALTKGGPAKPSGGELIRRRTRTPPEAAPPGWRPSKVRAKDGRLRRPSAAQLPRRATSGCSAITDT